MNLRLQNQLNMVGDCITVVVDTGGGYGGMDTPPTPPPAPHP